MNIRVMAALLVAFLALVSTKAAAQTAQSFVDPANGLSLDQAIAQALAQEPSIRAARTRIDVARGMREQAGLRRNLSTSAEFRGEPSGSDNQTTVSVEWPLDLFRRQGRVAVAEREVAAVELSVADRERLLAADVRARFGAALAAIRNLAVLDELLEVSRRQHELLRSRVDEGASPPIERDLVDVELRRLHAERTLQLGAVEGAMFELRRVLGTSPDAMIRLRDTLEGLVNQESSAAPAGPDAGERRPDVREAAARVAVAEARIDRAARDGRFDVSLSGGYMRMDAGFPQFGISPAGTPERVHGLFHYVTGGATVTLPFLNRNQGEVAAARAERAGAAALQEAAALSAKTEIAAARAVDQRAREAVLLLAGDGQALARRNLAIVRQSYELGRTTIFEVMAEQKRYLDFERAYTETLRTAFEARTALNRALGETR
jgi:cobalt-zinc-cadmium efflux system outer membrane protein